jgi:hypothetical protein
VSEPSQTTLGHSPPACPSVSELHLHRQRDQATANAFLEAHHPLGSVPGWRACWEARYQDMPVASIVVGRPVARHTDDDSVCSIIRLARRDDRPANTGSWLIARSRNWCRLEGYDTLEAHAGVAGNHGTVYEAAGFTLVSSEVVDTSTWTHREGRESHGEYRRRRWVCEL